MERVLSQDEIDKLFVVASQSPDAVHISPDKAVAYDFRQSGRIGRDQLRAINIIHENFSRSLASSLSGYLRAYVAVTLVAVEQISSSEFLNTMVSPTVLSVLSMKPYEANAVLELRL